tara:strand:- start:41 stop:556 length:516 start_codon:yes stop_codon:yes gene_type:complete
VTNEKQVVEVQLKRNLRSDIEVVAKCHFDLPVVVDVPKNLDDGTPFPTMFWLTCPMYIKKVSTLESHGMVKELDSQLNSNNKLRKLWSKRQKNYEKERNKKYKNIKNIISPSGGVGGTLNSIKCLHSHLADELVTGKNIIGQIVLENVGGCNCLEPCVVNGSKNKNWRSVW